MTLVLTVKGLLVFGGVDPPKIEVFLGFQDVPGSLLFFHQLNRRVFSSHNGDPLFCSKIRSYLRVRC